MGRIDDCFAALRNRGEAALIPFIMAGDPDLDTSRSLLRAAAAAGADLIEIGVPFSDPTADGPVLQRSADRALKRGASLPRILELVTEMRSELPPIVLFGYYNPIFHYGPARFAADARRAGVAGILVVDLPPDEAEELWRPARREGIDLIFLLAPTSDRPRVRAVLKKASGFVYFVSMTGVTGARAIDARDVQKMVGELKASCRLPIGVGFGVQSAADVAAVSSFADAVIVGTSIMRLVESHGSESDLAERIGGFIRELKKATKRAASNEV
jgi:tryptophan synthase alpha chain